RGCGTASSTEADPFLLDAGEHHCESVTLMHLVHQSLRPVTYLSLVQLINRFLHSLELLVERFRLEHVIGNCPQVRHPDGRRHDEERTECNVLGVMELLLSLPHMLC